MVFPQPAGPVTAKGSRVLCHSHQSLICAKNAGSKVWAASTGMVRESRESAVLRVVLRNPRTVLPESIPNVRAGMRSVKSIVMMEENSKEGSGENPSLVSGVFLPENSRKRVFQS